MYNINKTVITLIKDEKVLYIRRLGNYLNVKD